jgi:hypothetical protein
LLLTLARAVHTSWSTGFADTGPLPGDLPGQLSASGSGAPLTVRQPEGFAIYALYPEAYGEAAAGSCLGPETVVIGIRTIGTVLAAMVAAGLGAGPALTVRPVGHPFARRIAASAELDQLIARNRHREFAIVDEGPGLSGSSFGGVADWLEGNGVAPGRIHFFPGHGGELGPEAQDRHRRRWSARARHLSLPDPAQPRPDRDTAPLEQWVGELIGPLVAPLREISGGGWRTLRSWPTDGQPPVDTQNERRKFLARSGDSVWLVKFAGLGAIGEAKLRKARLLHGAGFGPEPAGLCHGFIVERWVEGKPLVGAAPDRDRLVDTIGRYLGFRARWLAPGNAGASLGLLAEMARTNVGETFGAEAALGLEPILMPALTAGLPLERSDTDNRMHGWEWLATPDGHLFKTDGLDHSSGHDLVGCQDICWDVAAAEIEHELNPTESQALRVIVADEADRPVAPLLVDFYTCCYLAFQVGLWRFAATSNGPGDGDRAGMRSQHYAALLARRLDFRTGGRVTTV